MANLLTKSMLDNELLRSSVAELLLSSKTKQRNFLETVELSVSLRKYDPCRDKRFRGNVNLPHPCRPNLSVCVFGDFDRIVEARELGYFALGQAEMRYYGKQKKALKKLC